MKRQNFGGMRRIDIRPLPAIAALAFTLGFAGCSLHAKQSAQEPAASSTLSQSPDSAAAPGPAAKIHIS
jgi:hypothetical protein